MQKISAIEYPMTDGGTMTVAKATRGWDVTFVFGSDASLDFTENVASVPDWMALVGTYCGAASARSID